ncbi:MAG: hypothetical protein KDA86_04445 [Planctomycetaceae bacterium]|nr:hypothetical protein [Planctomycetaceae bacterium]
MPASILTITHRRLRTVLCYVKKVSCVNYFAHGIRYLDRPYFLVGTAMPDFLSVVDRRVRFRSRHVEPVASDPHANTSEFAAGVLQHLEDDRWFHKTRGFFEVTSELTVLFRKHVDGDDRFRASFLGHVVTELLLDRVLIADHPGTLDRYYEAWLQIDRELVQQLVNRMSREPTDRLAAGLRLFQEERFLYDYADSERLLYRLNQVMKRVKLPPLPESTIIVLTEGEKIVRDCWRDLLPSDRFDLSQV